MHDEKRETASPDAKTNDAADNNGATMDYRMVFQNANDPIYILDADDQVFIDVNPAFEEFTGYSRDELINGRVSAAALIAGESSAIYQSKIAKHKDRLTDRYELRVLRKDGEKIPVELSIRRTTVDQADIVIGTLRDISRRKKLEQEMWDKIRNLGYASNRIYALTEKIKIVPDITNRLLHIVDEDELLDKAGQSLCDRQGLGYSEVNFYLKRDDCLELSYTSKKETGDVGGRKKRRKFSLQSDNKYVNILTGKTTQSIDNREAILPLKGRNDNVGVIEILFHPKEMEALEGNERAIKGYQNLVETLANIIGLLVENLRLYEAVKRQSITDQLTSIFNRRHFDTKLAEEIGRAARYGRDLSVLLIDIDKFKTINDTYGHHQGDIVLIETAKLLSKNVREVDVLCRYGGDEFAILMPETPLAGAELKAEGLRAVIHDHLYPNVLGGEQQIKATLSIGATGYSSKIKSADHFMKVVDKALYAAKRDGRNRVCTMKSDEK